MEKRHSRLKSRRVLQSQQQAQRSFVEVLSSANRRAHEQVNRRGERRALKSVRAAIAASELEEFDEVASWPKRLFRWLMALVLLPLCWVTTWTFLSQFSQVTVHQGFWQSAEFWYFAVGGLMMLGWFWSGLLQSFFLYLYVLGHELTHAIFVLLHLGKVTDFHVSVEGGYITTNKTNLVIALSPYFFPFWAVLCALLYAVARLFANFSSDWDCAFYAVVGVTWTFHMVWTLWMIPRDQPDLRENGTFLSLVIIYLANLFVLVGLLCIAAESPLDHLRIFGMEWLRHAATWGDAAMRGAAHGVSELREAGKF
jgi:hypothetical protein